MHTWIKFCGTTTVEDALSSVEAGADALGFIFAPSKRRVSVPQAQAIIRELPAKIERIGVFMNATIDDMRNTVTNVDLTGIQLHGNEFVPEVHSYLSTDRKESLRIIKKVLMQDGFDMDLEDLGSGMAAGGAVDAWLLDSGAGSGKTFDWLAARKKIAGRKGPFIVAGGLTPENVAEAIRIFSPWGVDVVSGIETIPGRKDPERMQAFVTAVRKAEAL